MSNKKTILLLTDFSYQAKGREYFREDIELSGFLRKYFKVYVCHIDDAETGLNVVDAILLRNTGPQILHHKQLMALRKRKDLLLFNDLLGKGDINGKYHLWDLFKSGFPVIPTFRSKDELKLVASYERYLLKPLDGADSCGIRILNHENILTDSCLNVLIQPLIDFEYEVSFYFIGKQFHYALYAPDPNKRWKLESYQPTKEDIDFALKFIEWNTCKFGIQRVDACRLRTGKLLLMELEDYNPFLSLDLVQSDVKEHFLESLCKSLEKLIENTNCN